MSRPIFVTALSLILAVGFSGAGLAFEAPTNIEAGHMILPPDVQDTALSKSPPGRPLVPPDTGPPGLKLYPRRVGPTDPARNRTLQPPPYITFEGKTALMRQRLLEFQTYLASLQPNELPSLQRFSAFAAACRLDWDTLERDLTPADRSYRSYRQMRTIMDDLQSLATYWIAVEKGRTLSRPTRLAEDTDIAVVRDGANRLRAELDAMAADAAEREALENGTDSPGEALGVPGGGNQPGQ